MKRDLYTVHQFTQRHPAFREATLRGLIFRAADNGLNDFGVVLRCNRKVLIDEQRFMAWLDAHSGVAPVPPSRRAGPLPTRPKRNGKLPTRPRQQPTHTGNTLRSWNALKREEELMN